ncbi:MAG: hypothetical protein ACLGIG_08005 [Actinomycetes bacterium]
MRGRAALLVGLVALGTLVADAAAVVHLRAEHRAQAAERAEQAAEQAYRDAVAQVLPAVLAARVPLLDADALFAQDRKIAPDVYYDVRVHGAIAADIADARAALAEVHPPPTMAEAHAELMTDLEKMQRAADGVSSADEDADTPLHLTGFRQAGLSFDRVVEDRVGLPVDLPRTADLPPDQLTRAGLVYRFTRTCSVALAEYLALPEPAEGDLTAIADFTDREAALVERVLGEMTAIEVPVDDAAQFEREVRAPLRVLAPAPQVLRDLAKGLRDRDRDDVAVALLALDGLSPTFEQVADALQRRGSSTCTLLFDGGLVDADSGPADDTTQT